MKIKLKLIFYITRAKQDGTRYYPNPPRTRLGFLKKFSNPPQPIYLNFKLVQLRVEQSE